jgi:hypothetical protein
MARCERINDLDVYQKRRDGGDDLQNVEVLCRKCYVATATHGDPGTTTPEVDGYTKYLAWTIAGHRCECTRTHCCHEDTNAWISCGDM